MEYAYFPGCSLEATARPYDVSLRRIFDRLGIGLREIEDWNCCGATSYITLNKLSSYAVAARNLACAEKMGGIDVCAPCSSCFTILRKVNRHMRWGAESAGRINQALGAANLSYAGQTEVLHPLEILVNRYGLDRLAERVVRRLDGVRLAPYYGCQIVRPTGRFDDPDDPQQLDRLFRSLGATVVAFDGKVRCCGGMLMTTCEEVALGLNRAILAEAVDRGAAVVVTTCPMCQLNLEAYQQRIGQVFGESYHLPIVFFSQLVGLALGFSAEEMMLDQMVVGAEAVAARPSEARA